MSVLLTEDEENVHKDIIPRDGRDIYHDFVSTDFSSLLFAFNAQERPQREAGAATVGAAQAVGGNARDRA